MKNTETKQFAGGILNRINRITMHGAGPVVLHYNDRTQFDNAGVQLDARSLLSRTTNIGPDERSSQQDVKENDV